MHSYSDRYTHDFFFERDYPDVKVLDCIFARLAPQPQEKSALQKQLRMDPDIFDKALEKLWIHGGAVLDFAENISRGQDRWRDSYIAHGEQKRGQINEMIRYAESNECRMSTLVRHFGDLADGQKACAICDFCAPARCAAQRFRTATQAERTALFRALAALRSDGVKSTGKLHSELHPNSDMSRDAFEEVLGAMARAGLVRLSDAVFEKNGKQISYRKVSLTRAAYSVDETTPLNFIMKDTVSATTRRKRKKKPVVAAKRKQGRHAETPVKSKPVPKAERSEVGAEARLEEALRTWRLAEAKRRGVPAFRIISDQALRAMASGRPGTASELLAIPGMGISTVEKYGAQIYRILHEGRG
jgi:superfamily II DNA helicase RecQ